MSLAPLRFGQSHRVTAAQDAAVQGAQGTERLRTPDAPTPTTWLGRAVSWVRTKLSSFGAALSTLFGQLFGAGKNAAAGGAQVGAQRGAVVSKGALLAGHIQDAQSKYDNAKKVLTTSIAYAEAGGAPEVQTASARAALTDFDARAETIFEHIGNRHRSSKSRQNQRAKLDVLAGEMKSLAARLDAATVS